MISCRAGECSSWIERYGCLSARVVCNQAREHCGQPLGAGTTISMKSCGWRPGPVIAPVET